MCRFGDALPGKSLGLVSTRFGRDGSVQQDGESAEKRAHYVRFGRGDGSELGLHDEIAEERGGDGDRASKADKRPNYVRFG